MVTVLGLSALSLLVSAIIIAFADERGISAALRLTFGSWKAWLVTALLSALVVSIGS